MIVGGLSNASHQVLSALVEASGMRWHLTLSAEDANTYKPASAIYQLALAAAPAGSGPPYLVAAHAWDLRAAADAGLRTAYVPRPGGDSPRLDDHFDIYAADLADLHTQLLGRTRQTLNRNSTEFRHVRPSQSDVLLRVLVREARSLTVRR